MGSVWQELTGLGESINANRVPGEYSCGFQSFDGDFCGLIGVRGARFVPRVFVH